jgi:hypothetical protein
MNGWFVAHNSLVPAITESVLMLFVSHCFTVLGLRYTTVKTYIAGIRYTYLEAGVHSVFDNASSGSLNRLHLILKGYKKLDTSEAIKRLPITFPILSSIVKKLREGVFGPYNDAVLECMCTVAFFAFLRCSEFTCNTGRQSDLSLCIGDIIVQSNDKVIIHLKVSKTDPFRHGVSIPLFATHQNVCPVVILRQILKLRWACKAIASDPLFVDYNGKPITRHMFVRDLKVLLERIGLNSQDYNSHSFRIGAATSASSAGLGEHLIRTLGRWSSDCYMRYIRTPDCILQQAQSSLCHN